MPSLYINVEGHRLDAPESRYTVDVCRLSINIAEGEECSHSAVRGMTLAGTRGLFYLVNRVSGE